MHKAGVLEKASELKDRLIKAGLRVKLDDSDNSMGWKCAQYEMKGACRARGDRPARYRGPVSACLSAATTAKRRSSLENAAAVQEQLELVQKGMFEKAKQNLDKPSFMKRISLEEAKQLQAEHGGFIKTMWCGELEGELKMKEEGGRHVLPLHAAQAGTPRRYPARICGEAPPGKDDLLGHRPRVAPHKAESHADRYAVTTTSRRFSQRP